MQFQRTSTTRKLYTELHSWRVRQVTVTIRDVRKTEILFVFGF